MFPKLKYHLVLQFVVIIAGFTGILGDWISISAEKVTFYRTLIAVACLFPLALWIKKPAVEFKLILYFLGIGVVVGFHWFTFFYSIKVSTISIAVICLSTSSLFMAFLEPIIFKRSIRPAEILLSVFIIFGMLLIFSFESDQVEGIIFGVISAFLASLFTVFNGKFVKKVPSLTITKYEMAGACLTMLAALFFNGDINMALVTLSADDWLYLVFLGVICTGLAFMLSVWVMEQVAPFTVSISYNLEPIYTIILALGIDWYYGTTKEHMSEGFYTGGGIILAAVFINALLKRKRMLKSKI